VNAVFPSVRGIYLIIFKNNFNMKKKLESIKDLKFQALEKNQMMKILGGDCKTNAGTRTMGNGDTYNYSSDMVGDDGTTRYAGEDDASKVKDLDACLPN
jgi:hypothetical protein